MAGAAESMITLTEAEDDVGDASASAVTAPDVDDLVITDNSELGVYEAAIGGKTAAGLIYSKDGSRVVLHATSVLPEFRGKGVATRLIGGVFDELRRQGKTATVTCPFTAAFVSSHPEYADVLDKAHPGWHTAGHERGH
ncbi:N-acetyltransferase [Kribbella turkmenica]|uniref:N-acetyltransferase n=1 Tax=Kribbella turkmenica TaxID=2530375 RepID=A0A4R4WG67_9ACTN|nr:GNAT family N-acetyltransferase [Kribbella turkmenica]TDD15234.1 N-acetyltransferase [Kribbella turkmenica]